MADPRLAPKIPPASCLCTLGSGPCNHITRYAIRICYACYSQRKLGTCPRH